jgi:hypothetical protein
LNDLDNESTWAASYFLISVKATQVAFFWWHKTPRLAFPLTKQYGTSNFLHSWGNQSTNSIGSTLLAMTTNLAFLYSTSLVTWLRPNLRTNGFAVSATLPSFFWAAWVVSLCFLVLASSGEYFLRMLNNYFSELFNNYVYLYQVFFQIEQWVLEPWFSS